jgi:hypothetical protein
MVNCVKNVTDAEEATDTPKRVRGGFKALKPFVPIYFRDSSYRLRRQAFIRDMVEADEKGFERQRNASTNLV